MKDNGKWEGRQTCLTGLRLKAKREKTERSLKNTELISVYEKMQCFLYVLIYWITDNSQV